MKKLLVIISLVLACTLIFSACKKEEETPLDDYNPGEVFLEEIEDLANIEDPNTFISLDDLSRFFVIESVESKGPSYSRFFHMALRDNCVIQPLLNGVDVSSEPECSSITITPPTKEGEYPYIIYSYTDGMYNAVIKVYYLTEEELNVSKIGGIVALTAGDEEVIERSDYGQYKIVKYLPTETTHAEIILMDKYFVTINGGLYTNKDYLKTVEEGLLDILTFSEIPLPEMTQVG